MYKCRTQIEEVDPALLKLRWRRPLLPRFLNVSTGERIWLGGRDKIARVNGKGGGVYQRWKRQNHVSRANVYVNC